MINKLVLSLLSIFDFFYKKKIIYFLKKNNYKLNSIIDVGAHKGESINFFLKNFNSKKIISFEPSPLNFKYLKKNYLKYKEKFKDCEIIIENLAAGNENKLIKINQFIESSSSTFKPIDENSNYYKKKFFFLQKKIDGNLFYKENTKMILLSDYINQNNLKKIDLLKIDTEGYEYEVLLGLKEKIKNFSLIFFEHHYDNMIKKNYTFRDINTLLLKNGFNNIFKIKMPFRKTFEYIYVNNPN